MGIYSNEFVDWRPKVDGHFPPIDEEYFAWLERAFDKERDVRGT